MKAIVCGDRRYKKRRFLFKQLDKIKPTYIIHGDAGNDEYTEGADRLAQAWAESRGVPFKPYPADWGNREGRKFPHAVMKKSIYGMYDVKAGLTRNQKMLDDEKPDVIIAFPGGTGTEDMIRRANKAGVKVIHIKR